MVEYSFTYKSDIPEEDHMLNDLIDVLNGNNLCGHLNEIIKISLSEAFNNALIHGNRHDKNKMIKLNIVINENEFSADIIDQGMGGLCRIKNKIPASLTSENGRGIDLISYYADEVDFEELSDGGLKVSMKFNRIKEETIKKQ